MLFHHPRRFLAALAGPVFSQSLSLVYGAEGYTIGPGSTPALTPFLAGLGLKEDLQGGLMFWKPKENWVRTRGVTLSIPSHLLFRIHGTLFYILVDMTFSQMDMPPFAQWKGMYGW